MRRDALFLIGLALLGLPGLPLRAEKPATAEERLRRDLTFLAGDQCEGRGITTRGINLAAEHIAREFAKAGLEPGGSNGAYFQTFEVTTGGGLGGNNRLVLRGPLGQAITLRQGKHFTVSALSGSGKAEAPVVFAGHGLTWDDPRYDDYAGLDVTGKVVVLLAGTPLHGHPFADVFVDAVLPGFAPHRDLKAKLRNLRKRKPAAVLVVNNHFTARFFGDPLPQPSFSPSSGDPAEFPVAHLGREWLDRMLATGGGPTLTELEKEIDAGLKPSSRPLSGWTCSLQTEVRRSRVKVKNVIGVLEGAGPLAKEALVLGAHYDHIGMGVSFPFFGVSGPGGVGGVGFPWSAIRKGSVHYGADDNASGTVALLELARRFAAAPRREGRRLVFIAFTAEEVGLVGSEHYCLHPTFPLERTAAMINLDMVGRLQDDRLLVGGLGTARGFTRLIDRQVRRHRLEMVQDRGGLGPSDQTSFYSRKVPVLWFFTGFHAQYHLPYDRVETVNVPGLRRVVDLVADVTRELRAGPRPGYLPTREQLDRTRTLWSDAPAIGILPDYAAAKDGLIVAGTVGGTPAAKAGLVKGDRITAVAGRPIKDLASYLTVTRTLKPGEKVEVAAVRDGKALTLRLELARPPLWSRFGIWPDLLDDLGGLRLAAVHEGSPAAKGGLREGDRIVAVAGRPLTSPLVFLMALFGAREGSKLELTVLREGEPMKVQVVLR